jgi:MYXO-CTERM domain-containing protein
MHTFRRLSVLFGSVAVSAALVTLPAQGAANIVSNGGFETGDFTGWSGTATGDPFNGVYCPGAGAVAEGACAAFLGPLGADEVLQQVLGTQAGAQYLVSLALAASGDTPSDFAVKWGGQTLYSVSNPDTGGSFSTLTFLAQATGASTTLSFSFRDDANFMYLDAVSVTAVPEPPGLALMALGVAALWARRRHLTP